MTTRTIATGLAIATALAFAAPARADEAWTGLVKQNSGATDYTVVMRLSGDGGETETSRAQMRRKAHPLRPIGDLQLLPREDRCIDGAITLVTSSDTLSWGSVGAYKGQTYAWSSLNRK